MSTADGVGGCWWWGDSSWDSALVRHASTSSNIARYLLRHLHLPPLQIARISRCISWTDKADISHCESYPEITFTTTLDDKRHARSHNGTLGVISVKALVCPFSFLVDSANANIAKQARFVQGDDHDRVNRALYIYAIQNVHQTRFF